MGISPLTIVGKHPNEEFEILWELVGEGRCSPLKQIVIVGTEGSLRLPFRRGAFSVETIEKMMKKSKLGKVQHAMFVSCDPLGPETSLPVLGGCRLLAAAQHT